MNLNRKKYSYIVKPQACIDEITERERNTFSLLIPLGYVSVQIWPIFMNVLFDQICLPFTFHIHVQQRFGDSLHKLNLDINFFSRLLFFLFCLFSNFTVCFQFLAPN